MEILLAFLRLGLTSFGGPVAHLGYFRAEFVERRRWLDERAFADLLGLCQFLPGPTSSQVGFCIGLRRGGPVGGLLAFLGFTLPSAFLMGLFAERARDLGSLRGLQLVAVAVVGHALIGMARTLTPDGTRAAIAAVSGGLAFALPAGAGQVVAIAFGAAVGWVVCHGPALIQVPERPTPIAQAGALACLVGFAALLLVPRAIERPGNAAALFAAFERAGSLVFGGGHVVLPLLQGSVVAPGWVSQADFLSGYGAAQAMPGPLFTFATYLGAIGRGVPNGLLGATIATAAIFAPGLLLAAGALPFWRTLRRFGRSEAIVRGCNAAVVGVLAAAFAGPVLTAGVRGPGDALAAIIGLLLLLARLPPIVLVALGLGLQGARNLV